MRSGSSRWFHLLFALMILAVSAPVQASPQAGEQIFALPSQAAPGGDLFLSGTGFTPGTFLELVIYNADTPDGYSLGTTSSGQNGTFYYTTALPPLAPGDYTVAVNNRSLSPDTPFQVLAPMEINLSQPAGPPGTVVGFTANNLLAGSLRLDYDGVPVFGPTEVPAGSFSNVFIVPKDRPANLGDPVTLTAVNLVQGRKVGSVETVFESQLPPSPVDFSFSRVNLPSGEFSAGEMITVTGQINPAPANLAGLSLKMLWKTGNGKIFPITQGLPDILADGSFTVNGRLPSLLNGDPAVAGTDAQLGLVLVSSGNQNATTVAYTPWGAMKPLPKFIVKVVDQNNNPIPNAIVDIRALYGADASGQNSGSPSNAYNTSALSQQNNQVVQALGGLIPSGENDPFNCPASSTYGRTDANGLFTFEFDPEKEALMGTKFVLDPKVSNKTTQIPTEMVFPLTVNALYTGHGQMVNGKPVPYQLEVRYSSFTKTFYNNATNTKLNTEPYVVVQPALPAGTEIDVPAIPYFPELQPFKVFDNFAGSGDPLYAFGNFLSFSNTALYPNSLFSFPSPTLPLRFQHDSLAFGALDEANLTFTLEGVKYKFQKLPDYSKTCGKTEYEAKITNPHRLSPGAHIGIMEIKDLTGHITRRYVQLSMINPPAWIGDTKLKNRTVHYNASGSTTGYTSIFADVLAPGDPDSTSKVGANLNKVGQVDNSAGGSYYRGEGLYPSGQSTKYYNGQVDTQAINEKTKIVVQKPAPGATQITFGDTLNILNTGRMPMFRDVWGVPPIASATIGADMWFKADLTYNGTISFSGPGGSSYSLLVSPSGTVGVAVFLDVSALFGVVSAHAEAVPEISFKIPATFKNGQKIDNEKCFRYKLDVEWEASIGYCPFCLSKSGTKNIFKGHQPADADPAVCSDPALNAALQDAAAVSPPPDADPSIAVDGFGHTLALWRSDSGQVVFSAYNGITWSTAAALTSNTSSGSPRVAFFAPNQALAVWTQSGLTPAQAANADFDTLARNQHLAYAMWNGTSWSSPQNLTGPTTGEGSPALAGCMSTDPGCPAGGAVAAVWVRDAGANLSLRQFRLYYAIFASGTWASIQPVDPASNFTDSEPSIAFSAGVPWVAWVRDTDRDLGTLADRILAHRQLVDGEPVVLDSSLPAGPSQPSLAVDSQGHLALAFTVSTEPQAFVSNKRQLYSARQECTPSCTWNYHPLVDSHGRAIFAEGPSLTLDTQDQAVITYRALGMGPLPGDQTTTFSEDVPGVILGTGAIAQVQVDFAGTALNPLYLTQGSAVGWQAAASFDPLLKQVVVTAAQGTQLPLPIASGIAARSVQSGLQPERIAQDEPVIFSSTPRLPDFAIVLARPSSEFPSPDNPFTVTLRVHNQGAAPGRASGSPELIAAWDGPPGTGDAAGMMLVADLSNSPAVTVTLQVSLPADLSVAHELYLSINPQQVIPEINYANNTQVLSVGGLPIPQGLSGTAKQGQSLVMLEWALVADSRVAGYHIYRRDPDGSVTPVGSSLTNGFADLTPLLDSQYEYMLTSFDEFGRESARSRPLLVQIPTYRQYLPTLVNER